MPKPPTPPPNFSDAIAAQIEYLEQLKQYQYQQWQKTEQKLIALHNYLALEPSSTPVRSPITDFFSLEAKKIEDSSVDIGSMAAEEGFNSNAVEEKSFKTNGKMPQQLPHSNPENNRSQKTDSDDLPKNIETVPVEKKEEDLDSQISLKEEDLDLNTAVIAALEQNPDGISIVQILKSLYPDGGSPQLKRKIYDRIYYIFKSGCNSGSIKKVQKGLFAASTSSNTQTPVALQSEERENLEEERETGDGRGFFKVGDRSRERGDRSRERGDRSRERGDGRGENLEEEREIGDGRGENGFKSDSSNSKFGENNADSKPSQLRSPVDRLRSTVSSASYLRFTGSL